MDGHTYEHHKSHDLENEGIICNGCGIAIRSHYKVDACYECDSDFTETQCLEERGCALYRKLILCKQCKDNLAELKEKDETYGGCINCEINRITQATFNLALYFERLNLDTIFADKRLSCLFKEFLINYNSILLYKLDVINDAGQKHDIG